MRKPLEFDIYRKEIGEEFEEYEKRMERSLEETSTQFSERIPKYSATIVKELKEEVERIKSEPVFKKMVELQSDDVNQIRKITGEIIGSISERVLFLKNRIEEVKRAIEERKALHEKLVREIEADIRDKLAMIAEIGDKDKIRHLKLDISLLRMEKRKEELNFWRDINNLRRELIELTEMYINEKKLAELISSLGDGSG